MNLKLTYKRYLIAPTLIGTLLISIVLPASACCQNDLKIDINQSSCHRSNLTAAVSDSECAKHCRKSKQQHHSMSMPSLSEKEGLSVFCGCNVVSQVDTIIAFIAESKTFTNSLSLINFILAENPFLIKPWVSAKRMHPLPDTLYSFSNISLLLKKQSLQI